MRTRFAVDVHLTPEELREALVRDVRDGLGATPKELPPKYFYDERGSRLFEEITRLPEYYPTRTERSILVERADEIAAVSGADTLVELGSGSSEKTRLLLDGLQAAGHLRRYVPVDVSPSAVVWISTRGGANSGNTSTCASWIANQPKTSISAAAATTR